jgi:hypothetical protein
MRGEGGHHDENEDHQPDRRQEQNPAAHGPNATLNIAAGQGQNGARTPCEGRYRVNLWAQGLGALSFY